MVRYSNKVLSNNKDRGAPIRRHQLSTKWTKKIETFYITFVTISELTRDEIKKNWKAKEDLARQDKRSTYSMYHKMIKSR